MSEQAFLKLYGPKLVDQGFPIIPLKPCSKQPAIKGWQKTAADRAMLDGWVAKGFGGHGVGVLSHSFPAIDLDVLDTGIVDQLVAWCFKNLGATVQRVGCAPKRLLVYRTDAPFTKLSSKKFVDFLGDEHKVEVLGSGQQFAAYAVHPTIKAPYRWLDGRDLASVTDVDMPLITQAQAEALVDYFHSIIPADWEEVETASRSRSAHSSVPVEERALAHAKPSLDIAAAELASALQKLDPDMPMTDWVRVGMALHHQFDGGPEGFDLWDSWSAEGAKYAAQEMQGRWASFKVDLATTNPVTAASILRMAKESTGAGTAAGGVEAIDAFIERYVLIEQGSLVCDLDKPPHCAVSRLEDFRNSTANIRHLVPAPTKGAPEREKLQPVHSGWLVAKERKTAQGVRYDPAEPFLFKDTQHGLWWVNEFYAPEFGAAASGDTAVFHRHMEYLFPVGREREWFIDWMAFNLQKPQTRCKVTPLHVSVAHGTGRGWLVELMGKLLGQWNCTKTKMGTLCGEGSGGGFTDFLDKSLFCAIEEVREGGRRYAVSDKTRDLLTENYLEVNIKHGSKQTQSVFTNFFFMSNHPDALVLTDQDRRINVFSGPKEVRERGYYVALYDWLGTEGVGALHKELMRRDLKGFDWQSSMKTEAREQMIGNTRSETETLFHELMADPPFPAMTFSQIVRALEELSEKDAFEANIDKGQLTKLLQHHAQQSKRIMVGGRSGKAVRPWLLDAAIARDTNAIRKAVGECGI